MTPAARPEAAAVAAPAMFEGAVLELYGTKVLVVKVRSRVLADRYESQLLVLAFHARFRRVIVLVAQDARGRPTYFGPETIARTLGAMPFDALTWHRFPYRREPPPKLPLPRDPPAPEPASSDTTHTRTTSFERPTPEQLHQVTTRR